VAPTALRNYVTSPEIRIGLISGRIAPWKGKGKGSHAQKHNLLADTHDKVLETAHIRQNPKQDED
jgi:hypothetical protein